MAAATAPAGAIAFCSGAQSVLTHTPAVPGESYNWYRNNTLISGATNNSISVTNSGNYHLIVTGANGCKNKSGTSNVTVNLLPDSTLNPANNITLCDGGTVKLQAHSDPAYSYKWYNGTQLITGVTADFLSVTGSGNYSVVITNTVTGCSSSSDATAISIIPPPRIFAGNDTVLATGQQYGLNAYELSSLGIDHYIWSPATGLNDPFIHNPTTTLYASQEYVVTGVHPSGCKATDTILIKVYKGPAIYVPSAFSPNADGKNDKLSIIAVGLKAFNYFEVYNRFGQKIFRTTNPLNWWDGTWNGLELTVGTYVWFAEGIDYRGKKIIAKGSVVIIK